MNEEVGNPLPAGAQLKEQYQVEEILGIGGFGITYLARDAVLDYKIAVKEYFPWELAFRKPDHSVSPRAPVTEQYFNWGLANFLKEARTLARFNHPNIVRVYNFFETNNTAYMVMEYEEGENLGSCLARKGALDEAAVRKILFPILDGLEALHAKNVIHRDIKPSNIFLRTAGIPLLLDFGNARNLDASRDLTVVVSPRYSPPEQFDTQERQGPWTDIYALGVVLYTMVSGYSPVDTSQRIGAVRRNRPDPLTPASEVGKGRYSAPFLRAIDWAMSFERHNRPQSIREWRLQLERVPDGPGAHGSEPAEKGGTDSQSKPVEEKRRNRGWLRGFFVTVQTPDPY
jgi:serine/threonine protein kinase